MHPECILETVCDSDVCHKFCSMHGFVLTSDNPGDATVQHMHLCRPFLYSCVRASHALHKCCKTRVSLSYRGVHLVLHAYLS